MKWKGVLRQTVKGKTKVALAAFTWLELGELVGNSIRQVGVVHEDLNRKGKCVI